MRMSSVLKKFAADSRANATARVAGAAFAVSFIAVLGAISLDRASKNGQLTRVAALFGVKGAQQYDYTPTGTVPEIAAHNVILDPCLGVPK
jgi:hypothetical protein